MNSKGLYADLKTANVFYHVNDDGTIQIMLGDFGLAGEQYDKALSTYPPVIDYLDRDVVHSEDLIVWEIGILTLNLLGISPREFQWNQIDNKKKEDMRNGLKLETTKDYYLEKVHSSLHETPEPFSELIENTLCPSENRWDLEEIIEWIWGKLSQEPPK
jgi:hypothetical protein